MSEERVRELAREHDLPPGAAERLEAFLDLLAGDPQAPSAVTERELAADRHIADSLSALAIPAVRAAGRIVDIGSGAGLPGLVLAVALPAARVTLLDSVGKRCAFLERALEAAQVDNAEVVCARAEAWPAGIGRHDLVTARAVGPLSLLCEYSAPLLVAGGTLVAWKGSVPGAERLAAVAAAGELGLTPAGVIRSRPYPGSSEHRLHSYVKTAQTPARFPRRPGAARKRPLGTAR